MKQAAIKVGCCGFGMAQQQYFPLFDCVEINSSFYQLPRVETALRWRAAAPERFVFSLKAWQVITHPASSPTYRRTRLDPREREHCGQFGYNATIRWAWDQTFAVATALRAALVLFQCPASFRPTRDNLAGLRQFFERAKRGRFAMGWEPRGPEWPAELVAALCRELDLIHVSDPFQARPGPAGHLRYFRLHGLTGARHRFSDGELAQLRDLCRGRAPVYCLFNNLAMRHDARRFRQLLAAS